jgi:PAP2 superfamily
MTADSGSATLPTQRGGRPNDAARPRLLVEFALVAALFLAYRYGRTLIAGHDSEAVANAWHVWRVERWLHLPDEEVLQAWTLHFPFLLRTANWYYVGVHFPITVAFLAWGWWKRPPAEYRWARRLLTSITAFAFVIHMLIPLAPPRMMTGLGFVDTMRTLGPSAYTGNPGTIANQFAAMPSLHVGWAMLLALVVIKTTRTRWRWVTLAHPIITTLVVVTTANHYWLDALVAVLILLLALLVTPGPYSRSQAGSWITRIGSVVGRREPPLGSTESPTASPADSPVTNRSIRLPGDPPRTPMDRAERAPSGPITHS